MGQSPGQGPGSPAPRQPQRAKNTSSSLVRVSSDSGLWLTVTTHQQEQLGSRQAEGHGRAVVAQAKWHQAGHFWSGWPACTRCAPEQALMAAPVPPETAADLESRMSGTWKGSPPGRCSQGLTPEGSSASTSRRRVGTTWPPACGSHQSQGDWPLLLRVQNHSSPGSASGWGWRAPRGQPHMTGSLEGSLDWPLGPEGRPWCYRDPDSKMCLSVSTVCWAWMLLGHGTTRSRYPNPSLPRGSTL